MLKKLKNILAGLKKENNDKSSSSEKTNTKLAAAVIMLETAHIDNSCTKEELAQIQKTIQTTFKISPKEGAELIEMAAESREKEVDLWQFTNNINESLSHKEKLALIESIWEIIYVDGRLERHEDSYVHQLAKLLRLSHDEMIDAKMRVKGKIDK